MYFWEVYYGQFVSPLEKTKFSPASGYQLEIASASWMEACVCFFQLQDLMWCRHMQALGMLPQSLSSHVHPYHCVQKALFPWFPPFHLATPRCLLLSPEGRDLLETSHSGLSVSRSLSLRILVSCESLCICSHLLKEETEERLSIRIQTNMQKHKTQSCEYTRDFIMLF